MLDAKVGYELGELFEAVLRLLVISSSGIVVLVSLRMTESLLNLSATRKYWLPL